MTYFLSIILLSTGCFFFSNNVETKKQQTATDSHIQDVSAEKIKQHTEGLIKNFGVMKNDTVILVSIAEQQLYLISNNTILKTYTVSTAKAGTGAEKNSNKTPLGVHRIKNKIGDKAPLGTIFFSRVASNQIAKIYTDTTDTPKDYVTTRLMWLEGLERGKNKGGNIDSYERYIYIHGTQEEGLLGKPMSMGCIRMKNTEVIELFNLVKEGTIVVVVEAL